MSELQRVLARLDRTPGECKPGISKDCLDAARLLRELAADFARFAPAASAHYDAHGHDKEEAAVDAAIAKWRLTEEPKSGGSCG